MIEALEERHWEMIPDLSKLDVSDLLKADWVTEYREINLHAEDTKKRAHPASNQAIRFALILGSSRSQLLMPARCTSRDRLSAERRWPA